MKDLTAWDLSDLYKNINDPKIKESIKNSEIRIDKFAKNYKGKLINKLKTSNSLLKALEEYNEIYQEVSKPILYAQLVFSESASDSARAKFYQEMMIAYQNNAKKLFFFEIELLEIEARKLSKFANSKELKDYSYFLKKLIKSKKHKLTEREEQLISDYSLSGKNAFVRLFDEEWAYKKFNVKEGKKQKVLSENEALHLLHSDSRNTRKEAAKGITNGLKDESRRMAFISNTLIQNKQTTDTYRNYKDAETSRHIANDTDKETVDIMCDVIVDNYKLVHKYYKKKTKLLNLKKMYDYDRYAPLKLSSKKYSVKEAKTLVLDTFYSFSEKKGEIAEMFFDKNWIDFKKRPGKRGGAYCSFITPDLHPYVFMNYEGSLRDVSTLAHELGHAIHAYLMGGLNYLNFDVPLTLAETASVFSEMLLFDHMSKSLKTKEERQALYVSKIDNSFATVFRQISMFLFERDFHKAKRETGEQSVEQINGIWRKRQVELYGKSIELTADYDYWWSYIPHFIHTPFYVYAYAFGELLTLSLYANYKKNGESFVPKYLHFLSQGGTNSPEKLLKPLDIDLKSKAFWQGGVNALDAIIRKI